MTAAPSSRWKNRAQCRRSPELVAAGRRRRSGAPRFPGSSPTSWLSLTTWRPALRARVNWPVSYVGRVTLPSARGSIAKARSMISSSSIGKRTCPDGSMTVRSRPRSGSNRPHLARPPPPEAMPGQSSPRKAVQERQSIARAVPQRAGWVSPGRAGRPRAPYLSRPGGRMAPGVLGWAGGDPPAARRRVRLPGPADRGSVHGGPARAPGHGRSQPGHA